MKPLVKNLGGLTTLFIPLKESGSTTIQIFVKAGSIYESKLTNGMSHFLEHMFFKGGKRYATPKIVAESIESFGGETNAYTGHEVASYYIKCPPQHTSKALDILADMIVDAQFPEEELEREKGVVVQEIKMYEDNPQALVSDKWNTRYFGDNPYGWTILWPEETVKSFSRDGLFAHKEQFYTKDNMILTIAWKRENQNDIEEQIGNLFARLPEKRSSQETSYVRTLPSEKSSFIDNKTQQNHLIIAAPSFAYQDEPRFYAAKLLSTILGGNMSSRLFQNIREKQWLCYYIGAGHSVSKYDGLFRIRAGIDKERFDFGLEKIYEEVDTFVTQWFSEQEFEAAQNYIIAKLQMGIESSDDRTEFFGQDYLLYGEIQSLEEMIASYKSLSSWDLESLLPLLARENIYTYHIQ